MFGWVKRVFASKPEPELLPGAGDPACATTYSERAKRAILNLSGKMAMEIIDDPHGGDGADSVTYRAGFCAGLNRAAKVIEDIQKNG